MTVKSVISAIKINASALADAETGEEVDTYLDLISHLSYKLDNEHEKSKKSAPAVTATEADAQEIIPNTDYPKCEDLSSGE